MGIPCVVDGQGRIYELLPFEPGMEMTGFVPYDKIEAKGGHVIIIADTTEVPLMQDPASE